MARQSAVLKALAALFALMLVAAACGSDDATDSTAEGDDAGEVDPDDAAADETEADETEADEPEDAEEPAEAEGDVANIAFFASSSQNGYNQAVWEGVQRAAAEDGNVEAEIFDGEFSGEVQFNQIEDIVASGRFDGYVIVPNDPVGVVPVAEQALAAGPTATALFPIGPDLDTLDPQLDGMITSAGSVSVAAVAAAEEVVTFCETVDPCRVIIIIGQLQFPFDNLRLESFEGVLDQHDNIEVLAVGEGQYSQDVSLTTMQDLLQANPEFEVLLSNADQHVTGALIALEDAGIDVEPMWVSGGGASEVAIEGIKAGTWDATISAFPATEGYLAAKNVIAELRGGDVTQVNDVNVLNDLGVALVTADVLEANPSWVAEWAG